jgi:hypothetical protein
MAPKKQIQGQEERRRKSDFPKSENAKGMREEIRDLRFYRRRGNTGKGGRRRFYRR